MGNQFGFGAKLGRGRPTAGGSMRRAIMGASMFAALGAGCGGEDVNGCDLPGRICTVVGNGEPAFNGDGLSALSSALYWPMDAEEGPDRRLYVLDWQNHRVRRVNADRRLETVMGNDLVGDGPRDQSDLKPTGAPGISVELNHPTDLVFMADGAMALAAWHNHKVRRLDLQTGIVTVLVGNGPGGSGDGGPAKDALVNQPKSVAVDPAGHLYVTDSRNQRVRKIDAASQMISPSAGSGKFGFDGDGAAPLAATFAMQEANENPEPGGNITFGKDGRLYLADTYNNRIRCVDLAAGTVTTVAGNGGEGFAGDGGRATQAQLRRPRDLEFGPDGRLYVADTDNHRIRAIDLVNDRIETVVGDGQARFAGEGGFATAASLHRPFGIGFDAGGNLIVADTFNNRIRRVAR
ncbi:MAG TPA: hypothetical protein VGG33_21555 [Polyangia bacterium]